MSLELSAEAFENNDGSVAVVFGVENETEQQIRIGTSMSQLYEVVASSDTVRHYGDSFGYMAAPHHLTLPPGKSTVFTRVFKQTHIADEVETIEKSEVEYSPLTTEVDEMVTIDITVFIRSSGFEDLNRSLTITPSSIEQREESEVISQLVSLPQTDNSIQMG